MRGVVSSIYCLKDEMMFYTLLILFVTGVNKQYKCLISLIIIEKWKIGGENWLSGFVYIDKYNIYWTTL